MRILLVEDEEKVSRFIVRGLTAEGFAVDCAPDGHTGLELATTYNYDLIFDLAEPVTDTVEQMRLLAEDKRITLSCVAEDAVQVEGDPGRLKQIVVNLTDNAIKYTNEGGSVDIRVAAVDGKALIEVSDSGVSIPSEALPHVFERFYRVDKARARQMGGAGLGLSIVKSICEAHGGQITVDSSEGEGSHFAKTDYRFPLLIADDGSFQDLDLSVRFKTVSGAVDRPAGLVFRLQDANNYYVIRANALEGNCRLYHVVAGKRQQFAGANFKIPSGESHELRVECSGNKIICYYDGGRRRLNQ
jgi:CheY-like chemotaxis protein